MQFHVMINRMAPLYIARTVNTFDANPVLLSIFKSNFVEIVARQRHSRPRIQTRAHLSTRASLLSAFASVKLEL